MTTAAASQTPPRRKGRTFGLFRVLAPALALLALGLAATASDPSRALAWAGQGAMMLAVALYAFRLKGRPVHARPPVHYPPEARVCLAAFCAGGALWGFGVMGLAGGATPSQCVQSFGLLIALVPFSATVAAAAWLRSEGGRAWRASLIDAG